MLITEKLLSFEFCNIKYPPERFISRIQVFFYHLHERNNLYLPQGKTFLSMSLLQLLNQMTNFHEIWHKHYTTGCHPTFILFNFLQPVTTRCMHETEKWQPVNTGFWNNVWQQNLKKYVTFVVVILLQNVK